MLKTSPLLLLVAAAVIQVALSQKGSFYTGSKSFNSSNCPINFYGREYTEIQVTFEPKTVSVCFNKLKTTKDCLVMERFARLEGVTLEINSTVSVPPPSSLTNVTNSSSCILEIRADGKTIKLAKFSFGSYGSQTVLSALRQSTLTESHLRFNLTLEGSNILEIESNSASELYFDLSGCRISEPPYTVTYGYDEHRVGTCSRTICHAKTGKLEGGERCLPVCSITGSSVVDFNGVVHSIPDRCVYSLVKPVPKKSFELLAGFQERRRLGVPFLDYLKLWLEKPSVTILLEQGGRVKVNGSQVSLTSRAQEFYDVELSIDQHAVSAKLVFANVTVSFDGTTARVSGPGLHASHVGLCGDPVSPSAVVTLSAVNSSSDNTATCGIQYNNTGNLTTKCDTVTAQCKQMSQSTFAACHVLIDPQAYITACTDTLCNYPAVDGLQCQFLESYAEACSLLNVTLGDWRSTTKCPVAPALCLKQYCSSHEFCAESSTGADCYCRAGFASKYKSTNTFGEPALCTKDSSTLSLAACLLDDNNIDYSLLTLNDRNCTGHFDLESHMVEFTFNKSNSCGSEVTINGTQAIFKNTLSTSNSSTSVISRQSSVFISFSCLYTSPQPQSVSFKIKEGSVVQTIESGTLKYTLAMKVYTDSAFTKVVGPRTDVSLNQKIWVELKASGLDVASVTLLTDSCWATNQPFPNATLKYDLIVGGCPNPKDETVKTKGNGLGLSNVFSFNVFEFTGKSNDVYLHCKLELCYKQGKSCAPKCGSRSRRSSGSSYADGNPALITMMWSN